jgi:pyruvate formate-lyase/glycerol dehydratase family glycyl radical enzyme
VRSMRGPQRATPTLPRESLSERVDVLKNKYLHTRPSVCTERARIYTEVYREHQAKPLLIRRALALRETLRRMTVFIDEGELIVGNQSSALRAAPIFPEYAVGWILKELDELDKRPGDAFFVGDREKAELRELCAWWQGKTLLERNLTSGDAHLAVNFGKLLRIGIGGYLAETLAARSVLDLASWEDLKKQQFSEAVQIVLEAFQEFIDRFRRLALQLADGESDLRRRGELEMIAATCAAIREHPPQDFREALQLTYFTQLVLQIESNGHSVSLGRMDQYLYPFYERDMASGRISDEEVLELLECTWLKLLSISKIRPWSHTRFSAGSPLYQNVTIGGQTPDEQDAVNPLSRLILDSVGRLRLTQPNLSVRYHRGMGEEFLLQCIGVIEKGFGMPAFNNDEIVIPELIRLGVEPRDAYDYSAIGCIEIAVPGKWGYRCTGMSFVNFMRVFMAALRDGRDERSGKTFCPGQGSLPQFTSFAQVMKAWEKQAKFYARTSVMIDTAVDSALEELAPDVLCSALVDDCIARGKTIKEGGAKYDFISGLQVGIANLGNSLAAIKKLVYEDRRVSPAELAAALDRNFEGPEDEKLRQLLLNHAPKYGNDDDYVDLLLREAYLYFIEELSQYHNTRYGRGPIGGGYYAGTSSISANVPNGAVVGATPDGRRAFTPLAEGCSPSAGTDIRGPTAVFKSVAKLPTQKILGGVLLNQKLSPAAIREPRDKRRLAAMLRAFFDDLKGWHVQYNIVSRDTLLKAKEDPESYRDLVVRVAGYSAFFTSLSPDTQDDIIARTEHTL